MTERKEFYRINKDVVLTLIQTQELKKWWVAEMAGIHKTTLRRWLSGKIHRVQKEHVDSLAGVLQAPSYAIAERAN